MVADTNNNRLSLWRLGDGTVWKHLGSRGTEPGQFICPTAVALTGAGALVVTDAHRVQVLTVDGAVLCVLDPTAVVDVGHLGSGLNGVVLYTGTDEILVADCNNHCVVALSWSPEVCCDEQCCLHAACFWLLYLPYDGVLCFVCCCIQCGLLDARAFGSQGTQLGQLDGPGGVVVTSKGDVWVADSGNDRLVMLQ